MHRDRDGRGGKAAQLRRPGDQLVRCRSFVRRGSEEGTGRRAAETHAWDGVRGGDCGEDVSRHWSCSSVVDCGETKYLEWAERNAIPTAAGARLAAVGVAHLSGPIAPRPDTAANRLWWIAGPGRVMMGPLAFLLVNSVRGFGAFKE